MFSRTQGIQVDPAFIFDVQAKRLHEYKRQLLNALHILVLYNRIVNDPNYHHGAASILLRRQGLSGILPGQADYPLHQCPQRPDCQASPGVQRCCKVVFLENYNVSTAEVLIPAAEISEQLSTAAKEASGTGNMKFMMNGALTIGTMDGANVEISEQVGMDNIYIFGMRANTVQDMYREHNYNPMQIYETNQEIRQAMTQMIGRHPPAQQCHWRSSPCTIRCSWATMAACPTVTLCSRISAPIPWHSRRINEDYAEPGQVAEDGRDQYGHVRRVLLGPHHP